MIYYKLKRVRDDGSPSEITLATFDRAADANARAKLLADQNNDRIAVVKVTEQHLGTFRSKEDAAH